MYASTVLIADLFRIGSYKFFAIAYEIRLLHSFFLSVIVTNNFIINRNCSSMYSTQDLKHKEKMKPLYEACQSDNLKQLEMELLNGAALTTIKTNF